LAEKGDGVAEDQLLDLVAGAAAALQYFLPFPRKERAKGLYGKKIVPNYSAFGKRNHSI
jgi:hypothetical protein